MEIEKLLRRLLVFESLVLVVLGAYALSVGLEQAEGLWLWEIISALVAAVITTFGLLKMRELTSE